MGIELFDKDMVTKQQMRYSLWRFYNKQGALLYVSQKPNASVIMSRDWWWDVDIVKIEHYASAGGLVDAKDHALQHENPLWNIHNIHKT